MNQRYFYFYQNDSFLCKLIFVLIFISAIGFSGFGQSVGEYRSIASGNWTTLSTWERYNGTSWSTPTAPQGYPGQYSGTNTTTIQSSHTITIGTSGISTQPMGVIIIKNGGQLYLTGSNSLITFFFDSPMLSIETGGSVYFYWKVKLVLATDGVIFVGTGGLSGDCNNNIQVWFGSVQFAACSGAPGNLFTFAQVMASTAGGTLNAIPSSNSQVCESSTINLSGSYSGAIGTTPTYAWKVTNPLGSVTNYSSQNVNITSALTGIYTAVLTVTTILNGTAYSNSETITIIVNPLPTLSTASQNGNVCTGYAANISLSGLLANTTFTLNYTINGVAQTPISGLTASPSGTSSFTTPTLTTANDGQILQITGITITSLPTNCYKSFSQNVTLSVWQNGSWLGVSSSDWNTASNWCGGVPTSTTDVIIRSGLTYQPVIGSAGGVCRNITINTGTSLIISGSNTLTVSGNWTNNGSFSCNNSSVIFNGTTVISGSSVNTFYNLTINSTKSLTSATANVNITGNFTNNGIFSHHGGSLTFNGNTAQNINSGGSSFNNLSITNTTANCTATNYGITVAGNFTTNSGTTLDMSTYSLVVNTVNHSGILITQNTSSTPITSGKTWGGSVNFTSGSAQYIVAGTYNNLNLNGNGGVTANNDITVNGILNLSASNPSSSKGILDMAAYTLNMGASSTTTGIGDVNGIVKRTGFIAGTSYTFGNQYTTIVFQNTVTLPSQLSIKIIFGSSPSWNPSAIKRYYDIIQNGSSGCLATLTLHYIDAELNGNTESNLVFWEYNTSNSFLAEKGKTNNNTTVNWVSYINMDIDNLSSNYGTKFLTLANSQSPYFVWNGSVSSDWNNQNNWSQNSIPGTNDRVIIPDTNTSYYNPLLPASTSIKSLQLSSNSLINSSALAQLTLNGSDSTWCNLGGNFNYGNSNIIFTNSNANILGSTNFYDLTVSIGSNLKLAGNAYLKIWGTISNNGTINTETAQPNTIEYAAGNQTLAITNPSSFKYSNLIFSGIGSISMPGQSMEILGNLNINGLNIVNTNENITIKGNLSIAQGSVLSVKSDKNLTVLGTTLNNAGINGMILESDAEGSASFIHNTNNIEATVKRFITGNSEDWHFLSSPVSDQSISGNWLPSGTYGNGTGYDLYIWNEPSSCWIYKLNTTAAINWNTIHPENNFVTARGYLYSVQNAGTTKEFSGKLNNSTISYGLTSVSTDVNLKGFNLIGNPYPSSIDWQAVSGWGRNILINSGGGYDMWIWNETAGNYGICSSIPGSTGVNGVTNYIAPMQGFFVQAANNGNITVNNSVRVHDGAANWLKNTKDNKAVLDVNIQSEADYNYDEIRLMFGFNENKSGATKLFSHKTTAPSLFFMSDNNFLSVKYFTNTKENPAIPIMFKPGRDGNYTFKCSFNTDDFDIIMLEDRLNHFVQNMKTGNTYKFSAKTTDDISRFVLHFSPDTNANYNDLPARIYNNGNSLMIDLCLINKETDMWVYNSLGQLLLEKKLDGLIEHKFAINSKSQILLIKLISSQGKKTQKILFNN